MPLHGFSHELHLSYWNLSQLIWTFSLEIYFWNSQKQLHSKLLRSWWRQNTGPTSLSGRIWFMPVFFIFVVAFFLYQTYSNDIWQLFDHVLDFLFFSLREQETQKSEPTRIKCHTVSESAISISSFHPTSHLLALRWRNSKLPWPLKISRTYSW